MELGVIRRQDSDTYKRTAEKSQAEELKTKTKKSKEDKKESGPKKTINANVLNLPDERSRAIKKLFAQKAALKVRMDQFKRDTHMDGIIQEHTDQMNSLLEVVNDNQSQINRLESLKKELKESYGVEENSIEQTDLELLEKQAMGKEPLTEEEMARLTEMGPLTDYQKTALDYINSEKEFQKRVDNATEEYFNVSKTIDAIKRELLKSSPMVKANKEADSILNKVDDEIQKAIIEELKQKVNENLNIDPNASILDNPQALIDQKKVNEEDLKGLAVDEKA